MTNEFIRELEEDMRAARVKGLWEKYGSTLIGLSVAIVLGTAAGVAWRSWRNEQYEQHTSALIQAEKADGLELLMKQASGFNHKGLAALRLAGQQREAGDSEAALKTYVTLAEDASQDAGLRSLASVLALHLSVQTGQPLDAKSRVAEGPFALLAREAEGWRMLKEGKQQEALATFSEIRDNLAAPVTQRQRMQIAASYLTAEVSSSTEAQ